MIPVKGGAGRKISAKEYFETLPKGARIVFIDPKEDFELFIRNEMNKDMSLNPLAIRNQI